MSAATRCSRRWPNCTTSPLNRQPRPRPRRWSVHLGTFYSQRREDFFFEYVREQLVHRYGAHNRAAGRAEGLHDDRPATCSAWRAKRSPKCSTSPKTRPRRSSRSTPLTATSRRWPSPRAMSKSQYNLAADGHRQPGSTFKAIVLADALSRGVDPNSTIYDSHTLQKGWLAEEPNYEVKTFGGEQNGAINLVTSDVQVRQHRLRPAGGRPGRGIDHPDGLQAWGENASARQPRAGARRAQPRRDAAGNGRRLRDLRRRRTAQHPDRDHEGRLPGRPHRQRNGASRTANESSANRLRAS